MTKPSDVQEAVRSAIKRWGELDGVFANGDVVGDLISIEEMEPDDWDQIMDTNLKVVFLTVKYFVLYSNQEGNMRLMKKFSNNKYL
ncbi:SDR family NAD(P)-dependent oxidoreductase [Paenibacillus lautus]|uniref:SDR family NAD(P)-dependent oxidoreductase n=1 Tax=Paenibacillus lautus TaxID=1401 RepID=UPI003D26FD8D